MTKLMRVGDQAVNEGVSQAVAAACERLDSVFPGRDAGGITSNFQGLLEEVVMQMLMGRSVLDGRRGHSVHLPKLVIDDAFFGNPFIRGELFLVAKPKSGEKPVLALDPDGGGFKALDALGDAWTSFEHAAQAAATYLEREGLTLEQAQELGLRVVPVVMIPDAERGYAIAAEAM